ncbi:MAG TPA: L,D-transpeptidase [Kineosporiaceae bacterium]
MTPGARVRRGAVAALLVAVGLATSGCGSDHPANVAAGAAAHHPSAAVVAGPSPSDDVPTGDTGTAAPDPTQESRAGATGPARVDPAINVVAKAGVASVPVYASTSDAEPWTTLANPLPSGAPLVFLVQGAVHGWVRVLVPVRPNQAQGWVRASDVTLNRVDYRIVVSVGRHTLTVYKAGKVFMTERAGIGTSTTPTPGGVYYVKELIKPTDPRGAYGPFAYGLSGYSNVLNEFAGGDGEIGIHGTDDPTTLGRSVSHGCIRISNTAITKLAGMLPLGAPVQIVR